MWAWELTSSKRYNSVTLSKQTREELWRLIKINNKVKKNIYLLENLIKQNEFLLFSF